MKTLILWLVTIGLFISASVHAQVDQIKKESSNNSSGGSSRSSDNHNSNSSSSGGSFFFFNLLFNGIGTWQGIKTQTPKENYPSMTSLEVMFQGAVQPSSYYVINPRIRGNWGLFSTDFRMNYLIEESAEGTKNLRTDDWQILQFNLVTSKYATFRLGTGFMHEGYSGGNSFNESSFMLFFHSPIQNNVGGIEYRVAKDWTTNATPRREWNIQFQHEVFKTGSLHGFMTLGAVFQRYYSKIDVWGIQAGFVFKLY